MKRRVGTSSYENDLAELGPRAVAAMFLENYGSATWRYHTILLRVPS